MKIKKYALRFYTTVGLSSGLLFDTYDEAVKYLEVSHITYWYKVWITDPDNKVVYEDERPYMVLRGLRLVDNYTGEVFYSNIGFRTREEAEQYSAEQPQLTKVVELRDRFDYFKISEAYERW